ncbi:MAG: hypothetical protein LBJ72_05550 [Dysgonamonadaceae bacterium]|jgi:hypothetical protein|nr:hypothetical protein [Dysgonamonadaceae bacterium]
MKVIKNILLFTLFAILTYGLVASKTVAYCCGMCHTEISEVFVEENSCCGSAESCCHEDMDSCCSPEDMENRPVHDCTDDPCRSEFVQFDWSPVIEFKSVTPAPLVLDLLYENHLLADFVLYLPESEASKVQFPLIVQPPPREYLSLLNILII